MKTQSAIQERRNRRSSLVVSLVLMTVSALDLLKMLEAIRQLWHHLGWAIILRTPLLERMFEIEVYLLLAMSGFWLAKACWRMQPAEGFQHIGWLLLFASLSATATVLMAKLPAEVKISGSIVMVLAAIATICVEVVGQCWRKLLRQLRTTGQIELASEGERTRRCEKAGYEIRAVT